MISTHHHCYNSTFRATPHGILANKMFAANSRLPPACRRAATDCSSGNPREMRWVIYKKGVCKNYSMRSLNKEVNFMQYLVCFRHDTNIPTVATAAALLLRDWRCRRCRWGFGVWAALFHLLAIPAESAWLRQLILWKERNLQCV